MDEDDSDHEYSRFVARVKKALAKGISDEKIIRSELKKSGIDPDIDDDDMADELKAELKKIKRMK